MSVQKVDWTVFDQYPPDLITCRCGIKYRSHAKGFFNDNENPRYGYKTRIPCPGCGLDENNVRRIQGNREEYTISKSDVGDIIE